MKRKRFHQGERVRFDQQLFDFGDRQRDNLYGQEATFERYWWSKPGEPLRCRVLFDGQTEPQVVLENELTRK